MELRPKLQKAHLDVCGLPWAVVSQLDYKDGVWRRRHSHRDGKGWLYTHAVWRYSRAVTVNSATG